MARATGSSQAALDAAKNAEGMRTSSKKLVYPGSDKREYSRWFATKGTDHELIIATAPVLIYGYRTACGTSLTSDGRPFCQDRLHRSMRFQTKLRDGVLYQNDVSDAIDLYAEVFGKPEAWTIIGVVQKSPATDAKGNAIMKQNPKTGRMVQEFRYDYRFVEIEGADKVLELLSSVVGMKFFASKATGIVGATFRVTKDENSRSRMGDWQLKMGENGPAYMDPVKLFEQIQKLSNRKLDDKQKKQGVAKMYYADIGDAYPPAEVDKQKMVLQTHFEIIQTHPEFAKRFPPAMKMMADNGALVAVGTTSTGVVDDGEGFNDGGSSEVSLDSIEGDGEMPNFGDDGDDSGDAGDDAGDSDGEQPDFAEGGEEEGGEEEGGEEEGGEEEGPTVYYANNEDDKDGYVLEDGTPCTLDGKPLTEEEASEEEGDEEAAGVEETSEEVEEMAEGDSEEPAEDTTSEDSQQDAGSIDVEGDATAFDFTEEEEVPAEEPKKQAAKKTPAKKTPAPAKKTPAKQPAKKAVAEKPKPAEAKQPAKQPAKKVVKVVKKVVKK